MSTASRRRAYTGPILFSFGFRPFFLGGAIWAAISAPLWVWSYLAGDGWLTREWHIHEMLFGALAAIVAGFLTTAVPNWTGRMPVIGAPLAGLVGLWIAGRAVMLAPGLSPVVTGTVDSAFLIVFAAVIGREVLAGRNWRNVPVCLLVSLMALGNVLFHLRPAIWDTDIAWRVGIAAIALLIALIGGRIVPSFTNNWLKAQGQAPSARPESRFDHLVLLATAGALAAWLAAPASTVAGGAMSVAGALNLVRLGRWGGWRTLKEPLVWILHIGYGWLALALGLLGLGAFAPGVPPTVGVHALTVGAVGVMTLAVMTRASRGHTGRALAADR
ncbi:MAG: NnrS family protein, partial [Moraxellaceae bacterium]|nr:NnrS family protein [Moraxellaceae bacterium]